MPTRKRPSKNSASLSLLNSIKPLPKDVLRTGFAELRDQKNDQLARKNSMLQKMAKSLGRAQGLSKPDLANPATARAVDDLLALHQKLASKKLQIPAVPGGLGGVLAGSISARATPPYDFDVSLDTILGEAGQPTLSSSVNKDTGQMSVSAISSTDRGFNGGSKYTTVGIYFHPTGPGTLTVTAMPVYSYQWWTNSLHPYSSVRSYGEVGLSIYGVDVANQTTGALNTIITVAGKVAFQWDQQQAGQVSFDFGSDLQTSVSASAYVNHTLIYLLFIEAEAHVEGVGWPGSLAGSKLSVAVPSISYEFIAQPLLES